MGATPREFADMLESAIVAMEELDDWVPGLPQKKQKRGQNTAIPTETQTRLGPSVGCFCHYLNRPWSLSFPCRGSATILKQLHPSGNFKVKRHSCAIYGQPKKV